MAANDDLKPRATGSNRRKERLAAQLKTNIKRRKEQSKLRAAASEAPVGSGEAAASGNENDPG